MSADNEIYTQLDRITDHLATMTKQERIAWFRRSAYAQPLISSEKLTVRYMP